MKYVQTTIYVNDLDKSKDFYSRLIGLEIEREIELGPLQIVFLGIGETKLELIFDGKNHTNPENMNISMGFACDDLDQSIELLEANAYHRITDIIKINEFIRFVFVKDPDGFKVQIVEHKM